MYSRNKAKSQFKTGDIPDGDQFAELFDSVLFLNSSDDISLLFDNASEGTALNADSVVLLQSNGRTTKIKLGLLMALSASGNNGVIPSTDFAPGIPTSVVTYSVKPSQTDQTFANFKDATGTAITVPGKTNGTMYWNIAGYWEFVPLIVPEGLSQEEVLEVINGQKDVAGGLAGYDLFENALRDTEPYTNTDYNNAGNNMIANSSINQLLIQNKTFAFGGFVNKLFVKLYGLSEGDSFAIRLFSISQSGKIASVGTLINMKAGASPLYEIDNVNFEVKNNCKPAIGIYCSKNLSLFYGGDYTQTTGGGFNVNTNYNVDIRNAVVGDDTLADLSPLFLQAISWGYESDIFTDKIVGESVIKMIRLLPTAEVPPDLLKNKLFGKKIIGLGDSMTAGNDGISSDAMGNVFLSFIASRNNMLHVNYGVSATTIINMDVSGRHGMVIRYADMVNDADYILVFGGTNDINYGVPLGEPASTDDTTFYGALNVLCSGLLNKYPTKKIGFITPYASNTSSCYPYIEAIEGVCGKYSIPVFNNAKKGGVCFQNSAQASAFTLGDNIHLNVAGHAYAADKYEAFLRSL